MKSATIEKPYNDKQFLDDKLSIVDVKATDDQGRTYQLEIQIVRYSHLPSRMLYTWASLHSRLKWNGYRRCWQKSRVLMESVNLLHEGRAQQKWSALT